MPNRLAERARISSLEGEEIMMKLLRCLSGFAAASAFILPYASAQDSYPSKPVHVIAGGAPGGLMDLLARMVATEMQREWGQPFIVDNRPGAAGVVAATIVAKATADGYTLLIAPGAHTIAPVLHSQLPYDPINDFTAVTLLVSAPNALVVRSDHPAKTVQDYIAIATAKPDTVTYATSGIGSTVHFGGELLASLAGIRLVHVPYSGGANQSVAAVLAGETNSSWSAVNSVLPFVKAGKARAIGVAAETRSVLLPDVPTFEEQGIKGLRSDTWYGILGPAKMPSPITEKLSSFLSRLVQRPDFKERVLSSGAEPIGLSLQNFNNQMRNEVERYKALARNANIKPQ